MTRPDDSVSAWPGRRSGETVNRILVIDSANVFVQYVELVVDRYGYDVRGVASAGEALETLAKMPIDLVIAQEKLPDMKWTEFLRKMQDDSSYDDIPVVVLSSDAGAFDHPGHHGLIVAEVQTRPVSMRDLLTVVWQHLPYKNRRREIRTSLPLKALIRVDDEPVPCQILNLSGGGVFVMRKNPFPIGTDVHLLLPLQDSGTPLEVYGKVVYVVETARGKHPRGMGVEFVNLEAGIHEKVNQYLENHVSSILGR